MAYLPVEQVGAHNVDIIILYDNFGIVFGHLAADFRKFAVRLFHDIRFGDDTDVRFTVFPRKVKRRARDPPRALVGDHLEIERQHAGDLHARTAQNVFPLGVFPEKRPVYPQLLHPHGADVGKQVELSPQRDVGAFERAALRRFRGAFQQNVAFPDFRKRIPGNGDPQAQTVFDGESAYFLQLNPAPRNLFLQQFAKNSFRLAHDDRADAVADQPYPYFSVRPLLRRRIFHFFRAFALFGQ